MENWYAKGDIVNDTIVIYKDDVARVCILQEQVIHGLPYSEGINLKVELMESYQDILEQLGIGGNSI